MEVKTEMDMKVINNVDMLLRIKDLTTQITVVITDINLDKQHYTFDEKEQGIRAELGNKYNVQLVQEDNSIPITRTVQYDKNANECIKYTIVVRIKEHGNILYVSPTVTVNITEWTVEEHKLQPIFHDPQELEYSTVCKQLQEFRKQLINPNYNVYECIRG